MKWTDAFKCLVRSGPSHTGCPFGSVSSGVDSTRLRNRSSSCGGLPERWRSSSPASPPTSNPRGQPIPVVSRRRALLEALGHRADRLPFPRSRYDLRSSGQSRFDGSAAGPVFHNPTALLRTLRFGRCLVQSHLSYQLPRSPKTSMTRANRLQPFSQLTESARSNLSGSPFKSAAIISSCSATET
jgi:hypothetical protein